MSGLALFLALAGAIFLAFPAQEWIAPLHVFQGARVLLFPALFCYGALALPFPAMIALAVVTGLLNDLYCLSLASGQVEIALGWSIAYFVAFGSFAHGFQPAFLRGHWWLAIPLSLASTSLLLAFQFLMINFRREGFVFNEVAAWRILGPGLMAGLLAPFIHFAAVACGVLPRRPPARALIP
ncbi:MAG: hypothetical protein N2322_02655 [Terrimicrobiaceae bacterium]|nr:hypothetical protein [Terrimicrobiaceae bacterium]